MNNSKGDKNNIGADDGTTSNKGGKGKGDNRRTQQQGYFFELFPDKNPKELRVVKCPKQDCFGCVLEDSDATACKKCGTTFKFPARAKRAQSPGASSTRSNNKTNR